MKPWHFEHFKNWLDEVKPERIGEIGCHDGRTGIQLCNHVLNNYTHNVHYTGYDAFDEISPEESYEEEINGKGLGSLQEASRWMNKVKKRFDTRFEFELIKGYTSKTLTTPVKFDFVYIDAGHSYESVLHDWNMVKESKLIVFDDWYIDGVGQMIKEVVEKEHEVEYIPLTENSRSSAVVRNW